MKRVVALTALAALLSGCASLAVRPCDSLADRNGKYAARFFLGILTLGISEAGVQQEQWLEAHEGWRFCGPPVAWPGPPPPAAAMLRTPGVLVNTTRWPVNVYLDTDPSSPGVFPLLTLRPGESRQLALVGGQHRIVAQPVAEAGGAALPAGRYDRTIQIEPRDRSFRLQLSAGEFK
jgi:hypothetical protein